MNDQSFIADNRVVSRKGHSSREADGGLLGAIDEIWAGLRSYVE